MMSFGAWLDQISVMNRCDCIPAGRYEQAHPRHRGESDAPRMAAGFPFNPGFRSGENARGGADRGGAIGIGETVRGLVAHADVL